MPEATINGTTIYYEESGSGTPCLVMHGGLGMDHGYLRRSFGPIEAWLRLVYYDHRWNGRSGRPPIETLTIEQLADDAAGLLDHLGLEHSIVLGHSYGGFVAQELALRHPTRVRAVILVDTTPGQLGQREDPADEQGEPPSPEMQAAMSALPVDDEEYAAMMQRILPFYLHRLKPEDIAPYMDGTILTAPAMMRSMEVLQWWSSVDRLASIAAPSLILAGEHDLVTSPPQSRRIAKRIPDSEVHVFSESGHFPWFEEPDAFFATVRDWLVRKGLVK